MCDPWCILPAYLLYVLCGSFRILLKFHESSCGLLSSIPPIGRPAGLQVVSFSVCVCVKTSPHYLFGRNRQVVSEWISSINSPRRQSGPACVSQLYFPVRSPFPLPIDLAEEAHAVIIQPQFANSPLALSRYSPACCAKPCSVSAAHFTSKALIPVHWTEEI